MITHCRDASRRDLGPSTRAIPAAVSAFPDELYQAPRSWAVRAYPKLIYYKKHDKGGHFAAWEQPRLLSVQKTFARASAHCASFRAGWRRMPTRRLPVT